MIAGAANVPVIVSKLKTIGNTLFMVIVGGIVTLVLTFKVAQAQSQPVVSTQAAAYNASYGRDDAFLRRIYAGIGFGQSFLEPNTTQVPNVDPNNRVNAAAQVMLGMDVSKWFSIEGHAASLGEAGLSPSGSISYQTIGLSALAYIGKNRHNFNRRGFSAFGRLGYGYLQNEPSPGLSFEQVNPTHVLFGGGLEYATRMGLGLRAEAIAFDTDVRYAQLSLLYRLGKRRESRRELVVQAPTIEPTPTPVVVPVPAIAVVPGDADGDGVHDVADRCPTTQSGAAVDDLGCALFTGVIEGVNFNSGSADLTRNAQGILSGVVSTLNQFPYINLTIMAHTDGQGDELANKTLSRQRARSVAAYLVSRGISVSRLQAFGFGEEQPMDTNNTAEGRLRNRRVEFRADR